ncbi:borealin-2-like [Pleurodeles waltl]|uniref:borealin-2-like n=1 Tax=Pleurodeles waltl TaxID=8319 RepID=UPI00370968D0
MPPKTRRNGSRAQGSSNSGQGSSGKFTVSQEQKRDKIEFFMREFMKQGKERITEIKREEEVLIAWAEKVCTLTILQRPMAMRKMTMGDFLGTSGEEEAAVVCANALALDDTLEPKIVRKNSKKGKGTPLVEIQETERKTRAMSSIAKNKTVQKLSKTKNLASSVKDVKQMNEMNLLTRAAYGTPAVRTCKKVGKSNTIGVTPQHSKRFQRTQPSKSRCLSSGGEPLFMDGGIPFVNIPLTDGQNVCFAGDDMEKIDVKLLDNGAVQTIEKLINQLSLLCKKASGNSEH